MLLRSSVVFLNGFRSSRGSFICQLSGKNLPIPKLQYVHCKNAHKSSFGRASSRAEKSLLTKLMLKLKTPLIFTVTTATACLVGNQYLGKLVSPQSKYDGTLVSWWNSKPDWFKIYWLLCGSCVAVFASFRLAELLSHQFPSYIMFMNKYFVTKGQPTTALESCVQLILSAFSHNKPWHLGLNMFVLHSVAQTLVPEMGKDRFLGGYMFCAVVSGFTSMAYQVAMGRSYGSVGASGAILGLLGLVMFKHPEYKFYIIFLPFFTIPAPALFVGVAAMDIMGLIRGWSFFDHAGHLGGLCSGVIWELLTKSQKPRELQEAEEITIVQRSRLSDKEESW